jgi:hypothetical protein
MALGYARGQVGSRVPSTATLVGTTADSGACGRNRGTGRARVGAPRLCPASIAGDNRDASVHASGHMTHAAGGATSIDVGFGCLFVRLTVPAAIGGLRGA